MVPALEVRGLTKLFFQQTPNGWGGLLVLDDLTFEVGEQEFVSVLGPSGCGKTTLARILAGIEPADRGEVLLDGKPAGPPGTGRCLVFQNYGLLAWRTVLGNVVLGLELRGEPKGEREATARKYVDLVGLSGFENHYPHQISGGMQQRTGLARALAMQPRMLIMDEPFGALDAQMRTQLQDSLLRICEQVRTTVLFVTHSVEEAVYLSDRILIFSARPGRQVAEVKVDLRKPRYDYDARSDPRFTDIRKQVTQLLAERTDYYGQRVAVHAD
ncbi:MAG TPA: ABC transporter ATP-binding protein [Chloroflexota bacterium]|nr:ABC transporter ATP-binding protein [Chloroflexota bacterium]